jgi:hypothetical protein
MTSLSAKTALVARLLHRFRFPLQWGVCVLLALLTVELILEFGLWKQTESFRGPFKAESSTSRSYVVQLRQSDLGRMILDTRGDERSDLRLWISGDPWGPSHTPHALIREGGTRAFSHWGNWVYFALPHEVTNSSDLEATATYSVRIRAKVVVATALIAAMLIWLRVLLAYWAGELARFAHRWGIYSRHNIERSELGGCSYQRIICGFDHLWSPPRRSVTDRYPPASPFV